MIYLIDPHVLLTSDICNISNVGVGILFNRWKIKHLFNLTQTFILQPDVYAFFCTFLFLQLSQLSVTLFCIYSDKVYEWFVLHHESVSAFHAILCAYLSACLCIEGIGHLFLVFYFLHTKILSITNISFSKKSPCWFGNLIWDLWIVKDGRLKIYHKALIGKTLMLHSLLYKFCLFIWKCIWNTILFFILILFPCLLMQKCFLGVLNFWLDHYIPFKF